MTAEEKAQELVHKFAFILKETKGQTEDGFFYNIKHAKQCALLAIDTMEQYLTMSYMLDPNLQIYWQQVKNEINNL